MHILSVGYYIHLVYDSLNLKLYPVAYKTHSHTHRNCEVHFFFILILWMCALWMSFSSFYRRHNDSFVILVLGKTYNIDTMRACYSSNFYINESVANIMRFLICSNALCWMCACVCEQWSLCAKRILYRFTHLTWLYNKNAHLRPSNEIAHCINTHGPRKSVLICWSPSPSFCCQSLFSLLFFRFIRAHSSRGFFQSHLSVSRISFLPYRKPEWQEMVRIDV